MPQSLAHMNRNLKKKKKGTEELLVKVSDEGSNNQILLSLLREMTTTKIKGNVKKL